MNKFPKEIQFDVAFFIDFTKSNMWQDKHGIKSGQSRYVQQLKYLELFLQQCKEEQIYYVYRFGDSETRDFKVLPLNTEENKPKPQTQPQRQLKLDEYCGIDHIIEGYNIAKQQIQMSGPSVLCPSLEQACLLQKDQKPLIAIILTDSEFTYQLYDFQQIIIASKQPISIIIIDVNDQINKTTLKYDTMIGRKFDNVNYFNINETCLKAFMEIPDQLGAMCKLGYLGKEGTKIIETVEYNMNSNVSEKQEKDII